MIRVLLVDDEAVVARALRRTLGGNGPMRISVDDCRTAGAALGRLQERTYDAVLVDWRLPDMDGISLGRLIRTMPRAEDCALIMVTGTHLGSNDECTALAAGFDDFVRKPFDPAVLGLRVVTAARRRRPVVQDLPRTSRTCRPVTRNADAALELLRGEPVAMVFGRPVALTKLEWKIVDALYSERGHSMPRGDIIRRAWGGSPPAAPDRALDQHVGNVRVKFGSGARNLLETIRSHGFRLRFWRDLAAPGGEPSPPPAAAESRP